LDEVNTIWGEVAVSPMGTAQDGAYTEVPTDGAYTETAPSRAGAQDGAWTDSGDGWMPVFTPVKTDYTQVPLPEEDVDDP